MSTTHPVGCKEKCKKNLKLIVPIAIAFGTTFSWGGSHIILARKANVNLAFLSTAMVIGSLTGLCLVILFSYISEISNPKNKTYRYSFERFIAENTRVITALVLAGPLLNLIPMLCFSLSVTTANETLLSVYSPLSALTIVPVTLVGITVYKHKVTGFTLIGLLVCTMAATVAPFSSHRIFPAPDAQTHPLGNESSILTTMMAADFASTPMMLNNTTSASTVSDVADPFALIQSVIFFSGAFTLWTCGTLAISATVVVHRLDRFISQAISASVLVVILFVIGCIMAAVDNPDNIFGNVRSEMGTLMFFALGGILNPVGVFCYQEAAARAPFVIVASVANLLPLVPVFYAVIFLGESFTFLKALLGLGSVVGPILLSCQHPKCPDLLHTCRRPDKTEPTPAVPNEDETPPGCDETYNESKIPPGYDTTSDAYKISPGHDTSSDPTKIPHLV